MASDLDIAWAAGLFEGEGSMSIPGSGSWRYQGVRMKLGTTDNDVAKRFHEIVGMGSVRPTARTASVKAHWKQQWVWAACGADAIHLMWTFRPYFGARRRARADECIAWFRDRFVKTCGGCLREYVAANSKSMACSGRCRKRLETGHAIPAEAPRGEKLFATSPRRTMALAAVEATR